MVGPIDLEKERHISLTVHTDASLYKWSGLVHLPGNNFSIADYWCAADQGLPIMVLEARALYNVLVSVQGYIGGRRVDAHVDNQALIHAWNNEGCKSTQLNMVLKDIFHFLLDKDIILCLHFVTSQDNVADAPSRSLQRCDATLSQSAGARFNSYLGGERVIHWI